jgi:hypothetical protein
MAGIKLVIKVHLMTSWCPREKGSQCPWPPCQVELLTSRLSTTVCCTGQCPCQLCLSRQICLNRQGGPKSAGAHYIIPWKGKKNNLTQPSMRGVLGAYNPKSFPLKGQKYPTCIGRKMGEGFYKRFKLESGRGIQIELWENLTAWFKWEVSI